MKGLFLLGVAFVAILNIVHADQDVSIYNDCPLVDSPDYTVHLPHEHDCTKFYKCLGGMKIPMDCPWMDKAKTRRLHFDRKEQVCNWPGLAGCLPGSPTTSPPPWETTPIQHETCPENGRGDVKLPHEYYCERYWQCLPNGLKNEMRCEEGLHFDPIYRRCDLPERANCRLSTTTTTTTPAPRDINCGPGVTSLPHECVCQQYYQCVAGQVKLRACNDGYQYNPTIKRCDRIENVRCIDGDVTPTVCPTNVRTIRLPHETSCGHFYQCNMGKKVLFTCPARLHFREVTQMCDFPNNANCGLRPSPPTKCPSFISGEVVRMRHECLCEKYYQCERGGDSIPTLKECEPGLRFDATRQICDHASNVDCSRE